MRITTTHPVPSGEIQNILHDDPSQKLWMLHDRYVTNEEVSDFNSQYVDYYNPEEPFDLQTATFTNVYFDRDENIFDQFTFGVGPQMIVQVRFDGDCKTKEIAATVVITGGRAPYKVQVSNDAGYYEAFNVAGQTQGFTAEPPYTYLVKVMDVNGLTAQTTVQAEYFEMNLDLGPDVILNASQTSVTLDAGQGITDPNASYQWYLDGNPIEAYGPTLTVTQPGKYSVSVTSGNQKCVLEDNIVVYYKFYIKAEPISDCGKKDGSLTITLLGGIAPFTTVISGNGQNIVQVHNSEVIYSTGMDYGTYNITSTDINGNTYQTTVVISPPYDGIAVNLYSQAAQICSSSNGVFTCPAGILDASQQVTNPNVSYQWFINGVSANIYTPAVQFTYNANYCANSGYGAGFNEYRVRVTNLATGCYKEEAIVAGSCYGLKAYPSGGAVQRIASDSEKVTEPVSEQSQFITKVYPNPSTADALFNYEINSSKGVFNGVVEIHSPTGALISSTPIAGKSSYRLPFSLLASGVYFITVTTNSTIITDKVIIK